jgi:hypothetical protein
MIPREYSLPQVLLGATQLNHLLVKLGFFLDVLRCKLIFNQPVQTRRQLIYRVNLIRLVQVKTCLQGIL